jgi:hypothetical protein
LLLLLLLCLPRHFLLHSKTDRETDRETDLSVKKKKTKANPRTIRPRLCLPDRKCLQEEERQNQEEEDVCRKNVFSKKKDKKTNDKKQSTSLQRVGTL